MTRDESVRAKIRALRKIADEDRTNPRIRGLAAAIFRSEGLWDPAAHRERAASILRWVQRNVIYVHEPVETFTRPRRLLLNGPAWRFGDCDEFTSTLCALYESVAFPTEIVALGWGGAYRHVFLRVGLPAGGGGDRATTWLDVEGTRNVPLGWSPVQAAARRLTALGRMA